MDPLIDALRQLKAFLEAQGILTRHSGRLDQEHILNWLDQFAQALERPEIVGRYQELRAAVEV